MLTNSEVYKYLDLLAHKSDYQSRNFEITYHTDTNTKRAHYHAIFKYFVLADSPDAKTASFDQFTHNHYIEWHEKIFGVSWILNYLVEEFKHNRNRKLESLGC